MENIITILQQIFMGKEDCNARVGLSEFKKKVQTPVQKLKKSSKKPQELRLSELMRKAY
ncbi:hypothetical protein J6G99_05530 [bacterium]|nr:hypothetical protein [bacterium]